MKIKAVLFDLDGTLLPMDQEIFLKTYLGSLVKELVGRGIGDKDKIVGAILQGIEAMRHNDGARTNEEAFWERFSSAVGMTREASEPYLEYYYSEVFPTVSSVCSSMPDAARVINMLKEKGLLAVLATTPMFPSVATAERIRWAGLSPSDFELFTTYEDFRYVKPSLGYYTEILEKLGLRAEECLMVGNDVDEDMVAGRLGMSTFLLTDCLINKHGSDLTG